MLTSQFKRERPQPTGSCTAAVVISINKIVAGLHGRQRLVSSSRPPIFHLLPTLECCYADKSASVGGQDPARPKMNAEESWVDHRKRTSLSTHARWRKSALPSMAEKNVEKIWKSHDVGYLRWRSSGHEGSSVYSGMENCHMVAEQECVEREEGSSKRDKSKWAGEEKDWIQLMARHSSEGRCNDQPPEDDEAADGAS